MYDFNPDIDELDGDISNLYGAVGDEIGNAAQGIVDDDEMRNRESGYRTLSGAIDHLEHIKVKGTVDEIDERIVSEFGKKSSAVPFAVAFGSILLNARVNVLGNSIEPMYKDIRKQTNQRFHEYRTESKGFDRLDAMIKYSRHNIPNIPDKVALDAPFKLTIPIAVDETMARRYREFNKRAQEFLAGKDFKIRTTEMTANLKSSLQQVLSKGFERGETRSQLVARVRDLLGPKSNASTIAITEVAGAVNFGEYEFAKTYQSRYEVEMWKTWIQQSRSNMRKTHMSVAGQTLKMNERFDVAGERMTRPHDPKASPGNTIRCGCYLEYETGDAKINRGSDERGVKHFIDVEEGEILQDAESIPYVNAQRIGAFANVVDGTEYVRDVYGISVDEAFTLEQVNGIADIVDAMPYETMIKNLQLTEVLASGVFNRTWAADYSRSDKRIRFNEDETFTDQEFREAFTHELAHSLHYADPKLFREFAVLTWEQPKGGDIFDDATWVPARRDGFFRPCDETSPKEHFADAVSWYFNRNAEFRALGGSAFESMFKMFQRTFGPVKP